ncbi:MAG: 2-C-methyl-D-erythritol 4-phosphate cytidylyltransferase [Candidatus Rhabdochlamydia sp.]
MKPFYSAVILMAGSSVRAKSSLPKQFMPLGNKRVYQHTLDTFYHSHLFDEVILVCHSDWVERVQEETASLSSIVVVGGGATRQASSFAGLRACHPGCNYVLIHDGARPFVSKEILEENSKQVTGHQAVNTCIPSSDTIIVTQEGSLIDTIPFRSHLRRGQTPQSFAYPLIYEAHVKTKHTNATDDCQLVLERGHPVALVQGSEENFKITTPEDIEFANWKWAKKNLPS